MGRPTAWCGSVKYDTVCIGLPTTYLHMRLETRGIHPMLFQCWPFVFDAGQNLNSIGWMPHVCWVQTSGVYASEWSSPLRCTLSTPQSLQRQYVLTCKVSRYCILALHGSCKITPRYNMYNEAMCYHVVFDSQLADPIINKDNSATLAQHWNTTGSMPLVYWSDSLEMWLTQIMSVWLVNEDYLVQWCTRDVAHRH